MNSPCKLACGSAASILLWNAFAVSKADVAMRPQKVIVRVQTVLLKASDVQRQGKTLATAFSSPQNAERFLLLLRKDLARHADTALASPVSDARMTLNQTSLVVAADPTPGQSGIAGILAVTPRLAPNGEIKLTVAASEIVPISLGSQWFALGGVIQTGRTVVVDGMDMEGPKQHKMRPKPRLILLMEIGTPEAEQ